MTCEKGRDTRESQAAFERRGQKRLESQGAQLSGD